MWIRHRVMVLQKGSLSMRKVNPYLLVAFGCLALFSIVFLMSAPDVFAGTTRELRYKFTLTNPANGENRRYEDETIKAVFDIDRKKIAFTLLNKADSPIKIRWDEVSYVDPTGESHRILPPQSATAIPPTAKIKDLIIPTDYGYSYLAGRFDSRSVNKQFLPKPNTKEARKHKGQHLSVLMPVEVNGTVKNYLFTFEIDIVQG